MFSKGGKTDKRKQMPNLNETDLKMDSTKLWNPTQNARKSHKIENFQNRLKLRGNRNVWKSLGKIGEKRKILEKYVSRPILEILKTQKMKNTRI